MDKRKNQNNHKPMGEAIQSVEEKRGNSPICVSQIPKEMPNMTLEKGYTEFCKTLGRMCPDKYSHKIEIGDSVKIFKSVLGMESSYKVIGRVIRLLDVPQEVQKILDGLLEDGEVDEPQKEILDRYYYMWGQSFNDGYLYSDAVACEVRVEMKNQRVERRKYKQIKDADVLKNLQDIQMDVVEYKEKGIKVYFTRVGKRRFDIVAYIDCCIDGDSVVGTKMMEDFKESIAQQGTVEGIAWSDELLDVGVMTQMNQAIDQMCKGVRADYHPGTKEVVRDIVHPGLYCYVDGVTNVSASDVSDYVIPKKKKSETDELKGVDFWGRQYEKSKYQWLPSEWYVSEEGQVQLNSPINNVDGKKYPQMNQAVADMFAKVFPMMEAVCKNLRVDYYGSDVKKEQLGKTVQVPLRGRRLQVVTKIVEYKVNEKANFDGVWHVEGMSHENILATALCIVKRDEHFEGADIEFRRFLYEEEGEELIYAVPQNANRPTDTMGGGDVRPLGKMQTPEGRVIVFPNSHIHRLSMMSSKDGTEAVRRIVVFWLVNPQVPIVSTAHVGSQRGAMSLTEAKRHRLGLMRERKLHKESYEQREVYLCEH